MKEIWIGRQLIFNFDNNLVINTMENKFEQLSSNAQSEHQVKQFKSKQQLKKEGYESTSNINDILENKGWNTNLYTDVEEIQIINNLQNANEEQADAIGFFLSALIYAGI